MVSRDAFERIAGEMIGALSLALPVDAVYLDLHGAMCSLSCEDAEGELLRRVRDSLGLVSGRGEGRRLAPGCDRELTAPQPPGIDSHRGSAIWYEYCTFGVGKGDKFFNSPFGPTNVKNPKGTPRRPRIRVYTAPNRLLVSEPGRFVVSAAAPAPAVALLAHLALAFAPQPTPPRAVQTPPP